MISNIKEKTVVTKTVVLEMGQGEAVDLLNEINKAAIGPGYPYIESLRTHLLLLTPTLKKVSL